jgi:hypothetical protein
MSPVNFKIFHKNIHPPEADALADSFVKAARFAREFSGELTRIEADLDSNWNGNQKTRFLDSYWSIIIKSSQYSEGTLPTFEKLFRTIQVEVEERVPILPQ